MFQSSFPVISYTRTLPVSASIAWNALTNNELLTQWFTPFDADLTKEFSFNYDFDHTANYSFWKVHYFIENSIISFGVTSENKVNKRLTEGAVSWRFSQNNNQVMLTVTDQTFENVNPLFGRRLYKKRCAFWTKKLNNLEFLLENISSGKSF